MNEKLLGLNPHFGGVLLPKKYQSSNFVQSPRVVDHKNTSAYQIWRWRHQVNWGPNLHFGRVLHPKSITHQILSEQGLVRSKPWVVDYKNTAPNMASWLLSKLGPNPHFWGVLLPKCTNHQILSKVSLRVVDQKNNAAYQICRRRHQVNWGPNLHFGRVLHPKSSTHQMLSKVSQRVVDNKNTAAYEIWWLGYQETWGPNHHFKGVLHHAL